MVISHIATLPGLLRHIPSATGALQMISPRVEGGEESDDDNSLSELLRNITKNSKHCGASIKS
jgi:hypothetical protein